MAKEKIDVLLKSRPSVAELKAALTKERESIKEIEALSDERFNKLAKAHILATSLKTDNDKLIKQVSELNAVIRQKDELIATFTSNIDKLRARNHNLGDKLGKADTRKAAIVASIIGIAIIISSILLIIF